MTILEALADRNLFGGLRPFRDLSTWHAWAVFLAAVYGLPLSTLEPFGLTEDDAFEVYRRHTGRTAYTPPAGGHREAVLIVGRQAGKDRIASVVQAYEAMTAPADEDAAETYALAICQDARAAMRTQLAYVKAPFRRLPMLKQLVTSETRDSLLLRTGVTLASYPCRPQAVRGLRARVAVLSEIAFFRSSEGYATDAEMLHAVRPTLATTGGRLIVLSSPYAAHGALHDLHRRHYGRDDSDVLVWQASAPDMNPTLPVDYLARMQQDDPDAYRSEVLGEFRAGVTTFFDPDVLEMSVAAGVRERAPDAGRTYVAHYDASGGRVDAAALAVAHADDERVVLDVIRAWPAPHDPAAVIAEACERLRAYRVREITGDRYSGEFVAEQFRAHGVRYRAAERDRSALYLDALPLVQAGRVVLLDDPALLRELRGLERRRGTNGRDRIDHRPGAHDDRAVAAAGALAHARRPARGASMFHAFTGRPIDPAEFDPFPFWR
jgi:hypothetical protein